MPLERFRGAPLASWEHRAVADMIDLGIPAVLIATLGLFYGLVHLAVGVTIAPWLAIFFVVSVILGFESWNLGWRQGNSGRSIGKQMMNLRVVRADNGRAPDVALNAKREVLHLLVDRILTLHMGYFLPFFTRKRQTIADYTINTLVVYDSRRFLPARASSFKRRKKRPPVEEVRDDLDDEFDEVLDVDSFCEELPSTGSSSAAV